VFCLAAPQIGHPALALALVGGMTFCHGGWGNMTLPAEAFPRNSVGTVTGLGGALGSWMGALSQLCIGGVVDAFGFTPIFIGCAGLYPLALLVVFLLIGKLGVVRTVGAAPARTTVHNSSGDDGRF
jgi:nitrate/nitrite transporter NarK